MGIRIHKLLGHGLQDVLCTKYRIEDPRFSAWMRNDDYGEYLDEKEEQFIAWIANPDNHIQMAEICALANNEPLNCELRAKDENLWTQCALDFTLLHWSREYMSKPASERPSRNMPFRHDGEFGLKNVAIFQPIECKDWYRYDDIIDYYDGKPRNHVKDLSNSCGIYPWSGMIRKPHAPEPDFLDEPTRKMLGCMTNGNINVMNGGHYNQLVGRYDKTAKPIVQGEMLDYLLKWYRPRMPASILLFTHFADIFVNWKETVQDLSPMIYTYWA